MPTLELASPATTTPPVPHIPLPPSVLWNLGPVHTEGECGSPPPVTLDALTSWYTIKTGRLVSLSEQELVNCCCNTSTETERDSGGGGVEERERGCSFVERGTSCKCSGYEWECVVRIGGLSSEAAYPPIPGPCRNNSRTAAVKIDGAKFVERGNETALQVALVMQPVATIVDASLPSFQFYTGGVYYDPDCSSTRLDHMMLVVGYGTTNDEVDYWMVRNSWGPEWGLQGNIMMSRNRGNNCGIATYASYPY